MPLSPLIWAGHRDPLDWTRVSTSIINSIPPLPTWRRRHYQQMSGLRHFLRYGVSLADYRLFRSHKGNECWLSSDGGMLAIISHNSVIFNTAYRNTGERAVLERFAAKHGRRFRLGDIFLPRNSLHVDNTPLWATEPPRGQVQDMSYPIQEVPVAVYNEAYAPLTLVSGEIPF